MSLWFFLIMCMFLYLFQTHLCHNNFHRNKK